MEHQTLTIFGNESSASISRVRKGMHLTANRKHGNAYLSTEAKEMFFGNKAKQGSLLVICSDIENNWYLAKSLEPGKGFECKLNDKNVDNSMRVNGMQKLIEKIAESFNYKDEKIVFEISEKPIHFHALELHKITLINF